MNYLRFWEENLNCPKCKFISLLKIEIPYEKELIRFQSLHTPINKICILKKYKIICKGCGHEWYS
jgi:hypothetical protein